MLVSIVVPVYKVEKYLRQCLDSILAQTFRDMEIIVVDDGSPDGCPGIIDEYAAKDARVVAVHQQNGGYGKAVNAGIARAKGKYVGIVESDDYIEPDMYAGLVETAERTGADLTRCTFSIFDGKRDFLWDEVRELNARDGDIINPHEELDYFLYHSAPWCYLYRRELFETIRLSESKGASYQDVTLVGEALLLSKSVAVVGRPLLHYRMENGQGSSCTGGGHNLMAIVDRCEELARFMRENGFVGRDAVTMMVRKSIRAVNWFYERINSEFRREFFGRLRGFFGSFAPDTIDWNAVSSDERIWLWTVLADRFDLSHPVLLQHPEDAGRVTRIAREVLPFLKKGETDWAALMMGAVEPAFPGTPRAVLCAADAGYLQYLSVTLASVIEHAADSANYDIVVFVDCEIDAVTRLKFDSLVRGRTNASIRFFDIRNHFTMSWFRSFFVDRHLSLATYYRFAAPYVLWNYERCLWLDCDTVACEDIAPLLATDMGGCCVGGCRDLAITSKIVPLFRNALACLESLGYRHAADYICAGVLLFDLGRMRGDDVVPRLLETCAAHSFRMHDQDGINLVCQDSIFQLDGKWDFVAHEGMQNYPTRYHRGIRAAIARRDGIWHFAGMDKPWFAPWRSCNFIWWEAARRSPYHEELMTDLAMRTAGIGERCGVARQREKDRYYQAGESDPYERKVKYLLPYGFMRRHVRRRYGMDVEVPLVGCPWHVRALLLVKPLLPYGLVLSINKRYAG